MRHVIALFVAATAGLAGAALAVDVYKWTDSQGVVHYGDRPASGAAASTLNVPVDSLTAEDAAAAKARLARARAKLSDEADADVPIDAPRRASKAAGSSCADAWKQYDDAMACFSSNRVANGKGVSGYGMATCKQVTQPSCAR
jgi:Domain of unknown function (DUF4124)